MNGIPLSSLGDDVLEIGAGPGPSTDLLREHVAHALDVEHPQFVLYRPT